MEAGTMQKTHPLIIVAAVSVTAASLAGIGAIFGVIPTGTSNRPVVVPQAEIQAMVRSPSTPAPVVSAATPAPLAAPTEPSSTLSLPPGTSLKVETPSDRAQAKTIVKPRPQVRKEIVYVDRTPPPPPSFQRAVHNEPPITYGDGGDPYPPRYEPPVARPIALPVCYDCGTIAGIREVVRDAEPSGAGAFTGGLLGGIVGNQMGRGHGRDAMTVIGAIGGAVAGHAIEKGQRSVRDYEITVRFDDGTSRIITQPNPPVWHTGERVRVQNGQLAAL